MRSKTQNQKKRHALVTALSIMVILAPAIATTALVVLSGPAEATPVILAYDPETDECLFAGHGWQACDFEP